MSVPEVIRDARRAAGITQLDLARRAGTAQPAVAAYESGSRTPTFRTLERLLDGCEHEMELRGVPRVRRGAATLASLAAVMAEDLARGDESDAVRLLFGFADDFRESSRPGRIALICEVPELTGDARVDAALAATAEFLAAEADLGVPEWVDGPGRFAEPWWFPASRPAFHAHVLANTPATFARHGVFLAREAFDRV